MNFVIYLANKITKNNSVRPNQTLIVMKKILENELMSLAHRILRLRGRDDIEQAKELAKEVYEKLSVLSFAEKHFSESKPSINYYDVEEALATTQEPIENTEKEEVTSSPTSEKTEEKKEVLDLATSKTEESLASTTLKNSDTQPGVSESAKEDNTPIQSEGTALHTKEPTPIQPEGNPGNEEVIVNPEFESVPKKEQVEQKTEQSSSDVDLLDIAIHYDDLPQFEPISSSPTFPPSDKEPIRENTQQEEPVEVSKEEVEAEKESEAHPSSSPLGDLFSGAHKPRSRNDSGHSRKSLNDRLKIGVSFGLNDRLAFINNLFEGSTEDYNRVISQLNTFQDFVEAREFIEEQVKPDYNWEEKQIYEERFYQALEKRLDH